MLLFTTILMTSFRVNNASQCFTAQSQQVQVVLRSLTVDGSLFPFCYQLLGLETVKKREEKC